MKNAGFRYCKYTFFTPLFVPLTQIAKGRHRLDIMEITYTERDGIFYPDLALPEQTNYPLGKYGGLRLDFLKKHRRDAYSMLVVQCRLNEHLHDIDMQAKEAVNSITAGFAKSRGIDEHLKAQDQLRWVHEMNNCRATAEEVVFKKNVHA